MAQNEEQHPQQRPPSEPADRLAIPLLVPVIVFLFAVLVIYGLSRIYLELNTIELGDVTMATPLAIGVSLFILGAAWYLASNRRVTIMQTATIGIIAVAALTGGAIWAAVDDRGEGGAEAVVDTEPTPAATATAGQVQVGLTEAGWLVTPSPNTSSAGEVTFVAANEGQVPHNLRVIKTDLAPDSLPIGEDGFTADESQLDVLVATADLLSGESEEAAATLEAGSYVLICNVAGHYQAGMAAAFNVE